MTIHVVPFSLNVDVVHALKAVIYNSQMYAPSNRLFPQENQEIFCQPKKIKMEKESGYIYFFKTSIDMLG